MIPTIGVMVGAYIFVRMLSLATRSGDGGWETHQQVVVSVDRALYIFGR